MNKAQGIISSRLGRKSFVVSFFVAALTVLITSAPASTSTVIGGRGPL